MNGFLEFSNYAKLCTFEHAWSTAEEGTSSPFSMAVLRFKMFQDGFQDGAKRLQDAPKMGSRGAKRLQDAPKMGSRGAKMFQDVSRWALEASKMGQ